MKITMIGAGYVGLVTGTCFAESGNTVTCVDIDESKVERLRAGEIPIYEPGLSELILKNAADNRLSFTTDIENAVSDADLVFLAVGTPQADNGAANLSYLFSAVESLAKHLNDNAIVVVKSTVPVGTNAAVRQSLKELTGRECDVASNPEFLKEGAAIDDFTTPDRVVIGVRSDRASSILGELYAPFLDKDRPILAMSPESAELTKYVANALLATKISFINEMANLSEAMSADINDVRRGIGYDQRIGFSFLAPGVGYGGSCFPKDVRALSNMASELSQQPLILEAVDEANRRQQQVLTDKVEEHFGDALEVAVVAMWGLAFKPRTDDIREAPALVMIDRLLKRGVKLRVFDPVAQENIRKIYGDALTYCDSPLDTLQGANALAINTEWPEFKEIQPGEIRKAMESPLVFDGRNLLEPEEMRRNGFTYYSIGRPAIKEGAGLGRRDRADS